VPPSHRLQTPDIRLVRAATGTHSLTGGAGGLAQPTRTLPSHARRCAGGKRHCRPVAAQATTSSQFPSQSGPVRTTPNCSSCGIDQGKRTGTNPAGRYLHVLESGRRETVRGFKSLRFRSSL
jgi:hypothetical protein